ncbi:MAG: hypothetical protein GAK35_00525 [Herbaspirillum frisingense]|uniref:Pilus assembly protein FimV n=1 Tax=Herbaspirillum frisingense TaxID=92645 RepID=A0A7V8FZP2_9BURK|nr:MAG: hypothetical protein GAK35_00525 [Herbaspirillum frisingense]
MLNQENMPGAGSVADTIEFMKRMWSGMGAPSMVTPSLSVDDINKKISDLKTVASWLELNLNMLKATIQTLEVQSATLSTLQAMSAIMASRQATEPDTAADGAASPPSFPFGFPMWPGAAPRSEEEEPEAAAAQAEEPPVEDEAPEEAPPASSDGASGPGAAPDFQAAMANPNAWWNVLQEQFKHAVGNAMAGIQAEEEPLLKPAKATKAAKAEPTPAKRSENKTVAVKARTARPAAPKAKPASASRAAAPTGKAAKSAPKKPPVRKAPKSRPNTSASARTAVVQSRQNKKPAPRKPTSP